MRIEVKPIEELSVAEYNPRINLQPDDPEYIRLKKSIMEFDYIDPVIWNEQTGRIVGGHQRLKILKEMGKTKIHVSVVNLDEDREKALNLALNKTGGDWDQEKLTALIEELLSTDIDIELTGFDPEEIDAMLNLDDGTDRFKEEEDFDPDEALENVKEPFTKKGDIWFLGKHRFVCGDSTSYTDAERLFDGSKADLIITDPPYNVDYTGKTKESLKIDNDKMANQNFYEFLLDCYKNMIEFTKKGKPIYVFHADTEGVNFRSAMKEAGWELKQCLIWVKNSMVMGRQDYHWQHEPILYGWKPGAAHSWYGERNKTTIFDSEVPLNKLSRSELMALCKQYREQEQTTAIRNDRPSRNDIHPTMKPLDLLRKILKNSSTFGNVIYDPFLGSGSTIIASEQLNRICYGIELDPRYADVIVTRYAEFAGVDHIYLERNGKKQHYDSIKNQIEVALA